jgi:N-acetylneuraminic acid mutarotase
MPEPRFAACAVGSDIFVVGERNKGKVHQASVFRYDTVANAWSTLAPMPHASSGHSASVMNGLVHIVGAGDGSGVRRFDPVSGAWTTLASTLEDH